MFSRYMNTLSRAKRQIAIVALLALLILGLYVNHNTLSWTSASGRAGQLWNIFLGDEVAHREVLKMQAMMGVREREEPMVRCGRYAKDLHKFAWITTVGSHHVMAPAIVLATTIEMFSCVKKKLVFVPETLEKEHLDTLRKVGFETIFVGNEQFPDISCAAYGLPVRYARQNRGALNRFHAWRLTQYDTLIYADTDFMLVSQIDELFYSNPNGMIAATRFEKPGFIENLGDTGFNSGLIVLRPNPAMFEAVLAEWVRMIPEHGCLNDQQYLWHFFTRPPYSVNLIPFAYNVRIWPYYPMRAFHFSGQNKYKVWNYFLPRHCAFNVPMLEIPSDARKVFWWFYFRGLDMFHFDDWHKATFAEMEKEHANC